MRILIAPDSFKGSTSSLATAQAIERGIKDVFLDGEVRLCPVADGGEGTVDALAAGGKGEIRTCVVQDPLGRDVEVRWGLMSGGWAVIEMAQASGLPRLAPEERDPSVTSTYGTGQMISAALDAGCRHILVGIGGSATNDGGTGMACALGARLLDADGLPLPPGGGALSRLDVIDCSGLDKRLGEAEILVASDVTNPLCGPQGASAVYGPQKGGTPEMLEMLDAALAHYGQKLAETFGRDFAGLPGAGAAGGLGAGLMAFCGGQLRPGTDIIFERLDLERQVAWADLIYTGEGRVDATSANGKLLSGIGRLACQYGRPVIALAGSVGPGSDQLLKRGIQAVFPIADGPITLAESLARAPELITAAAARSARLIRIGGNLCRRVDVIPEYRV